MKNVFCIVFLALFLNSIVSWSGPLVTGNSAGLLEKEFSMIWSQRFDFLTPCSKNPSLCHLSSDENQTIEKLKQNFSHSQPFEFYRHEDFQIIIQSKSFEKYLDGIYYENIINGRIVVDRELIYQTDDLRKTSNQLKVFLEISLYQMGLVSPEILTQKILDFWNLNFIKINLQIIGNPDLQIWILKSEYSHLYLFDEKNSMDLTDRLIKASPCHEPPSVFEIQNPFWSFWTTTSDKINVWMDAQVHITCDQEDFNFNIRLNMTFKKIDSTWIFQSPSTQITYSSIE